MRTATPRPRALILAAIVAACGVQGCGSTKGGTALTAWPTPAPPTLTAAAVQAPIVIGTAVAAEPTYQAIQLETTISDEEAAVLSKVSVWMNDQGERREEASSDSLHNPGVLTVYELETISRYNPGTVLFTRGPRPINAFDDGLPYAETVLGHAFIAEIIDVELDGKPARLLRGRPVDDPLRPAVPTDLAIWLDAESHRVLQVEKVIRPKLGPPYRVTTRPVAYDPPLEEEFFRLGPPQVEGLRVVDATVARPEIVEMTIEEAREALNFPILDRVELPEGIRLDRATVARADADPANGDEGLLAQFYARGESEGYLIVEQYAADPPDSARRRAQMDAALRIGEAVKVGDLDGVFVSRMGTTYLMWQTDATRIKISANLPEIDRDALVAWASAMR